jgi:hypothetical protein
MNGKRDDAPDPKGVASVLARAGETEGKHVAHRRPPDAREASSIGIKHPKGRTVKRPTPARLAPDTRAMLPEFGDGE